MNLLLSVSSVGVPDSAVVMTVDAQLKIEAMIRMARPGVKECELYAEMVKTEISQGGEAFIDAGQAQSGGAHIHTSASGTEVHRCADDGDSCAWH